MSRIINHDPLDANPRMKARDGRLFFLHDPGGVRLDQATARSLGFYFNSSRGYCLSLTGDVVQLHPELATCWDWVQRHFARVGLDCSRDVIWDARYDVTAEHPGKELDVFYFGDRAHQVRPDQDRLRTVQRFNQKNLFIRECRDSGLPVPPTRTFACKSQLVDPEILSNSLSYPLMLKASECISGYGVSEVATPEELADSLEFIEPGVAIQLQEKLAAPLCFINLQYQIHEGTLRRLWTTEQIMEGCKHVGNVCPGPWQPWHLTDPLARRMLGSGMKGHFAFDLAVCGPPAAPRFYLLECNPRYNGASYPAMLARRLGVLSWRAQTLATAKPRLEDLDITGLEYDPVTREGVVVYNWGAILNGILGVMVVGTPARQSQLMQELVALL